VSTAGLNTPGHLPWGQLGILPQAASVVIENPTIRPSRFGAGEAALTKGKKELKVISLPNEDRRVSVRPVAFAFSERGSAEVRFRVDAGLTGKLEVERAASLLAIHCVVRGQTPQDYTMMIVPQEALPDAVERRASELIEAGHAGGPGVDLTSRQQEVLRLVLQRLSNKEIATRLNVSERGVKFHISSLLSKFKVPDRFSLISRALVGLPAAEKEDPRGALIELTTNMR
jgi:DNA-binding NarL/FixJ family response regulator